MGYTTSFKGKLAFNKQLTQEQKSIIKCLYEYAEGGPNSYCQRTISSDGLGIEWDRGEKFYNYVERLEYIIKEYMNKRNILLNGELKRCGEDKSDKGVITVIDNLITVEKIKDDLVVNCPNCGKEIYKSDLL